MQSAMTAMLRDQHPGVGLSVDETISMSASHFVSNGMLGGLERPQRFG